VTGCANVIPPQGGPRDSIPPVLINANPRDSTTNFTGKRISFAFNEFVDVQNIQQNLIVSPTPRLTPQVDFRLNTVTVRLKDTLEPNTTYILNFGEAIRDYNEGNVLKEFRYIFSTGPRIDSLEMRGKVILAETGGIDTTLFAILHTKGDDSAVIRERPRYVTKLDGNGNFVFRNLPSGTFYLYALQDESGTRKYLDTKQLFAFADTPVVTTDNRRNITLYAYAEKKDKRLTEPVTLGRRATTREDRLRWQSNLTGSLLNLQQDLVLSFDNSLRVFDSTKVFLTTDSTYTRVSGYSLIKDSSNKSIRVKYNWKENTSYHLILGKDFAEDSSGKKLLKTDTLNFNTRPLSEYANLTLRLRNLDLSKNPVLLFIQNNEIKRSFPLTSADFSQPLFVPGEYQLSILRDDNKNGKWDPGEFFKKHKQPEIVKPIDRRIDIKAGQDNQFEIAL
jgi:uncharacterized protein (DUF2141 family)